MDILEISKGGAGFNILSLMFRAFVAAIPLSWAVRFRKGFYPSFLVTFTVALLTHLAMPVIGFYMPDEMGFPVLLGVFGLLIFGLIKDRDKRPLPIKDVLFIELYWFLVIAIFIGFMAAVTLMGQLVFALF